MDKQKILTEMFEAAVMAAHPAQIMRQHLPKPVQGKTLVVGAGKASAAMAKAFEQAWVSAGYGELSGLVVTQYGYEDNCEMIEVISAAHPVPDQNSVSAANRMLKLARSLGPEDQMIALISGGGSSLLCLPPSELGLEGKRDLNDALLRSGARISEMNCVRKCFSLIKGGRLSHAAGQAKVVTLVLSDVPGDDPSQTASGPTIASGNLRKEAFDILKRYNISLPPAALDWLQNSTNPETMAGERRQDEHTIIGAAQKSLESAAAVARSHGYEAHILSDRIEGEAREAARVHAALVHQIRGYGQPFSAPCILLSGGETTVTLREKGKGGRNTEFLLSLALEISGVEGVTALAADTDGIDGSQDNAGAFCTGHTVEALHMKDTNATKLLSANDAWTAFDIAESLFVTGPTHTNVNDFRAIIIE